MKVEVVDMTGKKTGTTSLPGAAGDKKQPNQQLLAQAVRVYLSNQRQGSKHAKTRGEVTGSGRKIWRQKGTGNARHGDRQAPLFVGGGVAHGPKGNENYRRELPKKMKRLALRSILSLKVAEKQLLVVKNLKVAKPKTKALVAMLEKVVKGYKPGKKVIIVVTNEEATPMMRAGRNLVGVGIMRAQDANPYELWRGGTVVMSEAATDELN